MEEIYNINIDNTPYEIRDTTKAPLNSPALTGTPTAPTPTSGDNSTKIATTAFVQGEVTTLQGEVTTLQGEVATKASLDSPALTGTPTSPTPSSGDDSTKLATTAYVQGEVASKAPLASPALTGTPTAPTPSSGDNSTKIATTAYVQGEVNKALNESGWTYLKTKDGILMQYYSLGVCNFPSNSDYMDLTFNFPIAFVNDTYFCGFDIYTASTNKSNVPVIMITAKGTTSVNARAWRNDFSDRGGGSPFISIFLFGRWK